MDGSCWCCQRALKILEEKAVSGGWARMMMGERDLRFDQNWGHLVQTRRLLGMSRRMLWHGDMQRWDGWVWFLFTLNNNNLGARKKADNFLVVLKTICWKHPIVKWTGGGRWMECTRRIWRRDAWCGWLSRVVAVDGKPWGWWGWVKALETARDYDLWTNTDAGQTST